MKELIILSGKGGTGKTSIAASFARLAERPVVADCDVDAADLHLVLAPEVQEKHDFYSGHEAVIRAEECTGCGDCLKLCRFNAVVLERRADGSAICAIDPTACEGCGVCAYFCSQGAIDFPDRLCGEWMVSEAASGPMVHARLGIAEENSGRLVAQVRDRAATLADELRLPLILGDGPPGTGCPVIASVTGTDLVVIVTEPTVSRKLSRIGAARPGTPSMARSPP